MNAFFKRNVLVQEKRDEAAPLLQSSLATLIDLALNLKQAHWNVVGANFRSLHLQLDEIIVTVRDASDEIAERIVTVGVAPDGRASVIARSTRLDEFVEGIQQVDEMIGHVADQLKRAIDQLRESIEQMEPVDPISHDLLIGVSSQLEKHLWMVQAQEIH